MDEKQGEPTPAARIVLWALVFVVALAWRGAALRGMYDFPETRLNDFFQDWVSARYVAEGIPAYADQEDGVRRYIGWQIERGDISMFLEVNAHPPSSILVVFPLYPLSYPDATRLWSGIWLCTLPLSFWLICRGLSLNLPWWGVFPVGAAFLVGNPLVEELVYGQFNLLILLCGTGAWLADRSGRPVLAGFLLGLVTTIKLFPGLLFLPFLVRRRWAVILSGAVTVLALSGLTLPVLGPQAYADYAQKVVPHVARLRDSWGNLSAPGFFTRLFHSPRGKAVPLVDSPALALACTAIVTLLVLGACVAAAWRARTEKARDHAFGLTLCAVALVSPIAWSHYLLLLLFPVLLLWRDLPDAGWQRPVLICCILVFLLQPFVLHTLATGATMSDWNGRVATPWQSLTAMGLHTYALVALFFLAWSSAIEASREPALAPQ